MRYLILLGYFICAGHLSAQEIFSIRFSDQKEISHWHIDTSRLNNTTGFVGVNEKGIFHIRQVSGRVDFSLPGLSLAQYDNVRISLDIGEEAPDKKLNCYLKNVPGNKIRLSEKSPSGAHVAVIIEAENDSLQLKIEVDSLSLSSRFSLGDIIISKEIPDVSRITCLNMDNRIKIHPGEDWFKVPFALYNRSETDATLGLRALEFSANENIRELLLSARLCIENDTFHSTTFDPAKIRFYNREGLCTVASGDSLLFTLEIQPHQYLMKDKQELRLYMTPKNVEYLSASVKLNDAGMPEIPVIQNKNMKVKTNILNYNALRCDTSFLYIGNCDRYNNVDLDDTSICQVKIIGKNERLELSYTVKGIEKLEVKLKEKEHYNIVLNNNDTIPIYNSQPIVVYEENFENQLPNWEGKESWALDHGRLKHALEESAGTSYYMTTYDNKHTNAMNFVWRININTGDWQSSVSNHFRYYLLSDSLAGKHKKAIYLTVDPKSKLPVLIQEVSSHKDTIWKGGRVWLENNEFSVKIMYQYSGVWEIYMATEQHEPLLLTKVKKELSKAFYNTPLYSGILFKHGSASRGGKLWVDYLSMMAFVAKQGCMDCSVTDDGIVLYYPYSMDKDVCLNSDNYKLFRDHISIPIDSVQLVNESVFKLCCKVRSGDYTIYISELKNGHNTILPPETLEFSHLSAANKGDLVIHEIMFKPSDALGLPKVEYIELYNLREYDLLLDSILFIDRDKVRDVVYDTIRAGGYLLLGGTGVQQLAEYAKTYRVKNFTLVDDSASLVLKNKNYELLDSVYYHAEWIKDKTKRTSGGYSLEKINSEVMTSEWLNWSESEADVGGTPGRANSVSNKQLYPEAESGDVLVNELLFNANPATAEYIELYNISDKLIALNSLQIAKRGADGNLTDKRWITASSALFEPHSLIWVCFDPHSIEATYQYHNPENCFITDHRLSYGDAGGCVVVLNDRGVILDEFNFDESLHNPGVKNKKGVALERISYKNGESLSSSWTTAGGDGESGMGSPGLPNRAEKVATTADLSGKRFIQVHPEVFTPNGDGYEDELELNILLAEENFNLNAIVYDSRGRSVKNLANNIPVHSGVKLKWDGRNAAGKLMPAGIYIIISKIIQDNGNYRVIKKACVISR
ncbi:gliding motility-associated C-terminal domain-containing protein [Porphyromonadaceae bacterium OttesenSCG-928-L07]|nr:gliding motility-associated C-terminal domain-containing protein [Porphyromonadaceae bacterium OttesenSCG-928-L07]MDL2251644.1 gliding motility-associated C-terminal domain-containing protein [Odoribacter sp. OttesenSCG-928-J03]